MVGDQAVERRERVGVDDPFDEGSAVAPRQFERDEAAEEDAGHAVDCPREAAEQVASDGGERLSGHGRDDHLDRLDKDEDDGCERSGGGEAAPEPRRVEEEGRVADDERREGGGEDNGESEEKRRPPPGRGRAEDASHRWPSSIRTTRAAARSAAPPASAWLARVLYER